jgi:hypothetical protein
MLERFELEARELFGKPFFYTFCIWTNKQQRSTLEFEGCKKRVIRGTIVMIEAVTDYPAPRLAGA